ncbi:MAG: hypothetical protein CM15mP127_08940 [Gammaproteobacteria bacterium]|nr:MAG: hypothetical protein CM15mP127_08940 [Gammaproteobacteria bacterium]
MFDRGIKMRKREGLFKEKKRIQKSLSIKKGGI